jgi:hypothetical protein
MKGRTRKRRRVPVFACRLMPVLLILTGRMMSQDFSNGTMEFIFRPANNWTQFVIWIENENSEYLATIFITDFIGRRGGGNRTGNPNIDTSNGNRLSALPVWSYKRGVVDTTFGIESYYPPAGNYPSYPPEIAAVTGATPGTTLQIKTWPLSGLPYGDYHCYIEANRSYDFNPYYQSDSYYRGQPSCIWHVMIRVSNTPDSSAILDYTGYGSEDGSDGEIHPPDSTITTAADLLRESGGVKFIVVYFPGSVKVEDRFRLSTCKSNLVLGQNNPNPFNSVTEIRYYLPQKSFVKLIIYDIKGQLVAALVNEYESAGDKRIYWDGRDIVGREVTTGIYIYRIQTDELTLFRRMIYIK